MITSDKLKFLENNLNRQLNWIKTAETKLSFTLAISTAALGVLITFLPKNAYEWNCSMVLLVSISGLLLLACLFCLSMASFPQTKGPSGSIIFFGGIEQLTEIEFLSKVNSLSEENYLEDLSSQCHRNAEIAAIKYKWIKIAVILVYAAIIPWLISLYLLYI